MSFKRIGSLDPHGAPVIRKAVLGNSITVTELDSIKLSSGFAVLGTTGVLVFGHAMAFSTKNQVGLNTTGATGAEMGSFVGTYTTASTNQAVGLVTADVDISTSALYSAEVDVTIGTTTGSDLAGYRMDLVDEDTLDESTAAATTAQYGTWGIDPENTAQAVVNIYESQVFGL